MGFLHRLLAVALPVPMVLAGWYVGASSSGPGASAVLATHPDADGPPARVVAGPFDPGGISALTPQTATAGAIAPGVAPEDVVSLGRTAAATDIPAIALTAYQRAGAVIDRADGSCNLEWELVAAIGRVESDHGRHEGSQLNARGVARPPILGVPLDGRPGTSEIADTDAGHLDGDTRWDRAVGPMQFIPSTWSHVAVDADGDGLRDPQDIDDAALAAAVFLCAGGEDLGSAEGRRSAVHRYNASDEYVDLVLEIMAAYARTSTPEMHPAPDLEAIRIGTPHRPLPAPDDSASAADGRTAEAKTGTKDRGPQAGSRKQPAARGQRAAGGSRPAAAGKARRPARDSQGTQRPRDEKGADREKQANQETEKKPKRERERERDTESTKPPVEQEPADEQDPGKGTPADEPGQDPSPKPDEEPTEPPAEEPTEPPAEEPTEPPAQEPEEPPANDPAGDLPACLLDDDALDPVIGLTLEELIALAPEDITERLADLELCVGWVDTDADGLPETPPPSGS